MSGFAAIEERLRAARPAADVPPPSLQSLLSSIDRAEGRGAPAGQPLAERSVTADGGSERPDTAQPRARRWWRRSRIMVPAIAVAAVLAGAGGVVLLEQGEPLRAAYVLPANPETGLGQPEAASLTPLPMRVADPEGGPPWAMRVIHTTRGLVCLQGGRLVDGQLGGLGNGYAFHADGRFHPFLAEDAIATDTCPIASGEQPVFLPGPPLIVTANALPLAGENVAPGDRVHCDLPAQEDWGVRCPQQELRQVAMGLLGSGADSIAVASEGTSFTVKPDGPDGAYLIVLPAPANANVSMSSNAVGGAVLNVTYADGTKCRIPATAAADQCHSQSAHGEAGSLPATLPSTAVRATYLPSAKHLEAPLLADARGTPPDTTRAFQPATSGEETAGPAVSVAFTAPLAAPNASTAYVVELTPSEVAGCATPALIVSQPSDHDISAGEQVQMTVPLLSSCATGYSGRVFLARSSGTGGESGGEGPLYEVIASQFSPFPGRSPAKFPTVGRFQVRSPG
jgi:hypothetical protein